MTNTIFTIAHNIQVQLDIKDNIITKLFNDKKKVYSEMMEVLLLDKTRKQIELTETDIKFMLISITIGYDNIAGMFSYADSMQK
jgi:hypothetical protein